MDARTDEKLLRRMALNRRMALLACKHSIKSTMHTRSERPAVRATQMYVNLSSIMSIARNVPSITFHFNVDTQTD